MQAVLYFVTAGQILQPHFQVLEFSQWWTIQEYLLVVLLRRENRVPVLVTSLFFLPQRHFLNNTVYVHFILVSAALRAKTSTMSKMKIFLRIVFV